MPAMRKICSAVFLAIGMLGQQAAFAHPDAAARTPGLFEQAGQLPADFVEQLFDSPLVVRVDFDGRPAGEATVTLSRDGKVQLVTLSDEQLGDIGQGDRDLIENFLREPRPLGACEDNCDGVLALHYNLQDSVLSIVTGRAEQDAGQKKYHALPATGSEGLITYNYLNLTGGQGREMAGRYSFDAIGSVGNWSITSGFQATQNRGMRRARDMKYSVPSLYAQREFEGKFARAGFFTPDMAAGIRPPRMPGGAVATTLGMMFGTSEALEVDDARPSLYPVYVTADRQGMVEIYRNGAMIHSQPVQPGLQVVDTRPLPKGIYEVEVRLVEDGQVSSTQNELIYKPTTWSDPTQPWKYVFFAGQERNLLGQHSSHAFTAGGAINYLVHPRVTLGASAMHVADANVFGGSIDWQFSDLARAYWNVYHSSKHGVGGDLQILMPYREGSVSVSHSQSWQHRDRRARMRSGRVHDSAITWSHRFTAKTSLMSRVSYASGATSGLGADLSVSHRHDLFGTDLTWRVAAFDRPTGTFSRARNRGVDLGLSIALGKQQRSYSVNLGTRSGADGRRDHYASLGVRQDLENGFFTSVGANGAVDRYGVSVGGNTQFEHPAVRGDTFIQRSSKEGGIAGGMNLFSTVGTNGKSVAVSGKSNMSNGNSAVIVDVESDFPDIRVRAQDSLGSGMELRPGRNLVPVSAYRSGRLQYFFDRSQAPAATLQPAASSYHLNRGGVGYEKLYVMKTMTVVGRLVDHAHAPVRAAHLSSPAGRSVTETDGFFALEVSRANPTISVEKAGRKLCTLRLDPQADQMEGDSLIVGELECEQEQIDVDSGEGRDEQG
ncbi:TcfC E-set like domain-containing protein [Burkholderia multivorans]|uniref:TcfC E-set like domain-containing protein n=1 Tax=Burkholderia multivorans TaxID=87883 RepID=UPI001C267E58|nr:TcfC E-set like domain-containing protein [Burkholderia multivorans]MBU9337260.1 TcfC E-set like domain-containing protein [Burkholderia multivorans]MCA8480151.1 TcfC E-set like domain-containing protein [Burkholderia multivorans]